jgi:hypothetical protein
MAYDQAALLSGQTQGNQECSQSPPPHEFWWNCKTNLPSAIVSPGGLKLTCWVYGAGPRRGRAEQQRPCLAGPRRQEALLARAAGPEPQNERAQFRDWNWPLSFWGWRGCSPLLLCGVDLRSSGDDSMFPHNSRNYVIQRQWTLSYSESEQILMKIATLQL